MLFVTLKCLFEVVSKCWLQLCCNRPLSMAAWCWGLGLGSVSDVPRSLCRALVACAAADAVVWVGLTSFLPSFLPSRGCAGTSPVIGYSWHITVFNYHCHDIGP
jgi:hypothetical protein